MDPKREREMPVINWRALQSLAAPARPAPPAPGVGARENIWDRSADMYREMAAMERAFTLPQLDVLPVGPEDFIVRDEGRYFLVEDVIYDWPYDSSRRAWISAYDDGGNVVTEFQIDQGTHSYFG